MPILPADPTEPLRQPSFLRRVGNTALGGLGAVANLLDIPGSMVRDVLAIENPLDQLLHPFSGENRTSGRDLLRKHGLAGQQDTWGNWTAGLATDVLTDPLLYLTGPGAAFGKAGQVAKAAGLMDDVTRVAAKVAGKPAGSIGRTTARMTTTPRQLVQHGVPDALQRMETAAKAKGFDINELLDEPLGGLLGVGVPFTSLSALVGTAKSPTAMKVAQGMDWLGDTLRYGKIPGTKFSPGDSLAKLFDASLQGFTGKAAQQVGKRYTQLREQNRVTSHLDVAELFDSMEKAGLNDPAMRGQLRQWLERPHEAPAQFRPIIDRARSIDDANLVRRRAKGINVRSTKDPQAEHWHRFITEGIRDRGAGTTGQPLSTFYGGRKRRMEWTFASKGGTAPLAERIAGDEILRVMLGAKASLDDVEKHVKGKYDDLIRPEYITAETREALRKLKQPETVAAAKAANLPVENGFREAAKEFASLSDETLKTGIWGNDPLMDFAMGHAAGYDREAAADALLEGLAEPGMLKAPLGRMSKRGKFKRAARQDDTVSVGALLKALGMFTGDAKEGAAQAWYKLRGTDLASFAPDVQQGMIDSFKKSRVDRAFAKEYLKLHKRFDTPEAVSDLLSLHDSWQNLFKMGVTAWPGFSSRNLVSGQFNAAMIDALGKRAIGDTQSLLTGGVVQGAKDIPEVAQLAAQRGFVGGQGRFVQRIEEPGVARATFDKPHGIYTSPMDIVSPHADLGGERYLWRVNPATNVLQIQETRDPSIAVRAMASTAGAGVWAARQLLGPQEFAKLKAMTKGDAIAYASSLFPNSSTDWSRYYDTQEVIEAIGGLLARQHGYDAIDFKSFGGREWDEFVGLTPKAMSPSQILDDESATDLLRQILFANEAAGKYEGMAGNIAGKPALSGASVDELRASIPGKVPFKFRDVWDQLLARPQAGTTWNPLKAQVRGVAGAEHSTFAPAAAADAFNHWVESMNRIPSIIHLMREGVHSSEAAKIVGQAQVKYSSRFYTPFEQQVLARIFPFYKFTRGQLPFVLKSLIEHPGGKLAQTLRVINRSRGEDELVPDYVAESASVPLGTLPEGSKRFITGFGLPFEDPLSLLAPDPQSGFLEALSRTSPILKGPLEFATGESFFQRGPGGGRDFGDMDPTLGRTLANLGNLTGLRESKKPVRFPGSEIVEQILGNSPLSRVGTSLRTATDPRKGLVGKGLNLLTGIRVTDVSPGSQDALLRERAQQLERQLGAKSYQKTYFTEEIKAEMSPKQRAVAEQLEALRKLLEQRAKSRAAAKERQKS